MTTKITVISGSSRAESYNLKLATQLAAITDATNAEVSLINLKDFDLPIYNGDLEDAEGLPGTAKLLKLRLAESTGLIFTCPEYNGFMTPLLINAIDWCTRSEDASVDLSGFTGKTVLVASASPGAGGGARAATHLKTMLSGLGSVIFPQSMVVPSAYNAFDDEGKLLDEAMTKRAEQLIEKFVQFTNRFA